MEFMSVQDVARLMGLKQSAAYELLAGGHAPSVKIHGRVRVPRVAWDAWYNEQVAKALAAVKTPETASIPDAR